MKAAAAELDRYFNMTSPILAQLRQNRFPAMQEIDTYIMKTFLQINTAFSPVSPLYLPRLKKCTG